MSSYQFPQNKPENKQQTDLAWVEDERGNVLFLILVAIAIYAALAYVVGQSTRSTGGDASKETTTLQSSQITQYGTEIQTAIMRMKISNGCTDEQISFENPHVAGYTNPNAPGNYSCHVFRPEGGNVTFKKPPKGANDGSDYLFTGQSPVQSVGTTTNLSSLCYGTGSETCADLVMLLPLIAQNLCNIVQIKTGNSSQGFFTTEDNGPGQVKFIGVYGYTGNDIDGSGDGGTSGINDAKQSGCTKGNDGNFYYYHVLIPR